MLKTFNLTSHDNDNVKLKVVNIEIDKKKIFLTSDIDNYRIVTVTTFDIDKGHFWTTLEIDPKTQNFIF